MGYYIEFVESVLEYLQGIDGLTDEQRAEILEAVTDELSRDADRFHSLYPLSHESLCFRYNYPHPTEKMIYDFDFIVSASHRAMSVMQVVYIECDTIPIL
jgi:hypothetical protein